MRLFLFLIIAGLLPGAAFGQDSLGNGTWRRELGINTNFFTNTLAVKYKVVRRQNTALRIGLEVILNESKEKFMSTSAPTSTASQNYTGIIASVGKEFRKPLDNHWMVYYGADITPGVYVYHLVYHPNPAGYKDDVYFLGARPFFGVRYSTGRLCITAEASVVLAMAYESSKSQDTQPYTYNTKSIQGVFGVSPSNGLFLFYRF